MIGAALPPLRRLPTRSEALESYLSRWRDWHVRSHCGDECCPPNRPLPVADIEEEISGLTVHSMANGLRCSTCGSSVGNVSLVRWTPGGQITLPVRGAVNF